MAWGSNSIDILGFTPSTIAGSVTSVPYTGYDVGSSGNGTLLTYDPVFSPQAASTATLLYADDLDPTNELACIRTTLACGNLHVEVFDFLISYSELPIGLRAFGVEGAGDPVAGATPNRDMAVDLSAFRNVPEPTTLALFFLGAVAASVMRRNKT